MLEKLDSKKTISVLRMLEHFLKACFIDDSQDSIWLMFVNCLRQGLNEAWDGLPI